MSSNEKTEKQITEALIDGRRADLLRIEHGRVRDLRDVIAGGAHMAGTAVQNALRTLFDAADAVERPGMGNV